MYQQNIVHVKSSKLISQYDIQQRKIRLALERRAELTNIIKLFFNFVYYLGACPFRFNRDQYGKKYYRKVWKPQQVLCGFMHILCIFRLVSQVRELLPEKLDPLNKNPTAYFKIFLGFFDVVHKMVVIKRFWFNGQDYLKVLNEILKKKYLPIRNTWITGSAFLFMLYGLFTLKIVTCIVAGYKFVVPISKWSPSWWLRRIVKHAKFVFCFTSLPNIMDAPEMESITLLDGCLAFLMAVTHVVRYCMAEFCDVCILAFTLTLWVPANSFAKDVYSMLKFDTEEGDDDAPNKYGDVVQLFQDQFAGNEVRKNESSDKCSNWRRIYKSFQAIQDVSKVVNTAVGSQLIWYLLECLMYYSIYLNSVFLSTDWYDSINMLIFVILTIHNLYMSADICNKIESVKSWLVKNNNIKSAPTEEVYLVLHEVTAKDIGIRGNNAFTITFSFIAGYLSVMVTFFIICVQQTDLKQEN